MPPADILLCAGDFTLFGKTAKPIIEFNRWLGQLPYRHRIVTCGNHEYFLEADAANRKLLDNATLLINESVVLEGLKFYGSPITAGLGGAFALSSAADRRRLYATVPHDIDILISHSPALGILDSASGDDYHAGCPELLEAIARIRPKLHVCGHIHPGYGMTELYGTLHVNASLAGAYGDLENAPVLVRISKR